MSTENLQNKPVGIDGVYWWKWGEIGGGGYLLIVGIYFAFKNTVLTFADKLFLVHVMTFNKSTFIS